MDSTLLTGPKHARLEQWAFQRADDIATDSLGSVLYITRNDARRSMVEDRWTTEHAPLRLRAETLDTVVREWYEQLYGPTQLLSGQLNRRLTEYALDSTTAEADGALAGEPASAALADSFSSRFSLFDDAGVVFLFLLSPVSDVFSNFLPRGETPLAFRSIRIAGSICAAVLIGSVLVSKLRSVRSRSESA